MTTIFTKTLPLAAFLLMAVPGCELINFDAPVEAPPDDPISGDGGGVVGPQPLYPFRPGATWQYQVTNLDGSQYTKWVTMDKAQVMVGGTGLHQLDMAYPVRITVSGGGASSVVRLQQAIGDQIVTWREEQFDRQGQLLVDSNLEPQQIEIDQSTERTKTGASWQDSYTKTSFPIGGAPVTAKLNETWSVVGEELLMLPTMPSPTKVTAIVFQKTMGTGGGTSGGDAGTGGDAGKTDAGISRPMLSGDWSQAADGGAAMPKTLWFARGIGKVKEAGGGQPTEELTGAEIH